jgi:hypothetical protein
MPATVGVVKLERVSHQIESAQHLLVMADAAATERCVDDMYRIRDVQLHEVVTLCSEPAAGFSEAVCVTLPVQDTCAKPHLSSTTCMSRVAVAREPVQGTVLSNVFTAQCDIVARAAACKRPSGKTPLHCRRVGVSTACRISGVLSRCAAILQLHVM